MVICLERGADLHMAQLMPLPLTVSCFSKMQMVLLFWYWLSRVVPAIKCVRVLLLMAVAAFAPYSDASHSVVALTVDTVRCSVRRAECSHRS